MAIDFFPAPKNNSHQLRQRPFETDSDISTHAYVTVTVHRLPHTAHCMLRGLSFCVGFYSRVCLRALTGDSCQLNCTLHALVSFYRGANLGARACRYGGSVVGGGGGGVTCHDGSVGGDLQLLPRVHLGPEQLATSDIPCLFSHS